MPADDDFERLTLLHQDIASTWLALEKASGRRLLLHKFSKASGFRDRLVNAPPADLMLLVSAFDEGDDYVVVTHDMPALRHFRQWIESRPYYHAPSHAEQRPVQTPPKRDPVAEPGEFTRMFANVDVSGTAAPPKGNEARSGPGEFTRLFQTGIPERTAPPQNVPSPSEPGEFTRMFSTPMPGSTPPHEEIDFLTAQPAPAPTPRPPGEFTRMFNPAPEPSVNPSRDAGATGIFSSGASWDQQGTPMPQAGPSEYTRILQQSAEPVPAESAAAPQTQPQQSSPLPAVREENHSNFILTVIVLAVLAVSAIALVLYFAFRR